MSIYLLGINTFLEVAFGREGNGSSSSGNNSPGGGNYQGNRTALGDHENLSSSSSAKIKPGKLSSSLYSDSYIQYLQQKQKDCEYSVLIFCCASPYLFWFFLPFLVDSESVNEPRCGRAADWGRLQQRQCVWISIQPWLFQLDPAAATATADGVSLHAAGSPHASFYGSVVGQPHQLTFYAIRLILSSFVAYAVCTSSGL